MIASRKHPVGTQAFHGPGVLGSLSGMEATQAFSASPVQIWSRRKQKGRHDTMYPRRAGMTKGTQIAFVRMRCFQKHPVRTILFTVWATSRARHTVRRVPTSVFYFTGFRHLRI